MGFFRLLKHRELSKAHSGKMDAYCKLVKYIAVDRKSVV